VVSTSIVCMLFVSLVATHISPVITDDVSDLDSRHIQHRRPSIDKFEDISYFSFYTFFKSGIEPDCIEMICDDNKLEK